MRALLSLGVLAVVAFGCATAGETPSLFEAPREDAGPGPNPPNFGQTVDFSKPILDDTEDDDHPFAIPPEAADQFAAASDEGSSGPCLLQPELGDGIRTLYPNNWLRPRYVWTRPQGQNIFELRIHADNQEHDLVYYTSGTSWGMPKVFWDAFRALSGGVEMTVAIRGATWENGQLYGVETGSYGSTAIAPVSAGGTIVYWATQGYEQSLLKYFRIDDFNADPAIETPAVALSPSQVTQRRATCVGCHTGAPDGRYVITSIKDDGAQDDASDWADVLARIDREADIPGAQAAVGSFPLPPTMTPLARQQLELGPLGISAVSAAHWTTGDRMVVASDGTNLIGINLEATVAAQARKVLVTGTVGASAACPAWSHDGQTLVYVRTNRANWGRLGTDRKYVSDLGATGDLYAATYSGGSVGTPTPLVASSDLEFYPAFSPDDKWIAFNRAAAGLNMYNQPGAEVYVVPRSGQGVSRIAGNSPPSCTGVSSPGVTNSWPKWAPTVETSGGDVYYWLVFSSTRPVDGDLKPSSPQLYIAPIVAHADGQVDTNFGAVRVWNLPLSEGNHTPAWDNFRLSPQIK